MTSSSAAALTAEERFSRTDSQYTSKDIRVLEGIQAIQLRPAMYIGSTSTSGLVHLVWEALDNAVDEAVAGYGSQIWVEIDKEGVVRVQDEGRGMPFDPMTYHGKRLPTATVLLTVPHSGGKFGEGAYKTAGGLHGVGATVINALSEWLELDVWREGQHFSQRFERGKPLPPKIAPADPKKHGTQLRWRYDGQIFDHDAYYPGAQAQMAPRACATAQPRGPTVDGRQRWISCVARPGRSGAVALEEACMAGSPPTHLPSREPALVFGNSGSVIRVPLCGGGKDTPPCLAQRGGAALEGRAFLRGHGRLVHLLHAAGTEHADE